MDHEQVEKSLRDVGEGGAGIDHPDLKFITARHQVVVHRYAFDAKFIGLCFPGFDPSDCISDVTLSVIAADLEVTPVLPKAKCEHLFFDDFAFDHLLKNRFH